MSRNLKIKAALLVAFAIASTVAHGIRPVGPARRAFRWKATEATSNRSGKPCPGCWSRPLRKPSRTTSTFDEIYRSKAETLRFMALHETGFEVTDAKMQEYRELLGVDNVLVVNRAGEILAQAQEPPPTSPTSATTSCAR